MKNPTIETGASRLAVLSFAGFGAGIALMHVLRPDYALANHMVSDYAVGPWGAVMTGAFACASIGCLALAIGLVRSRLVSGVGWLVAALFAVAAVGLTVTALYPTDVGEGPPTPTGRAPLNQRLTASTGRFSPATSELSIPVGPNDAVGMLGFL